MPNKVLHLFSTFFMAKTWWTCTGAHSRNYPAMLQNALNLPHSLYPCHTSAIICATIHSAAFDSYCATPFWGCPWPDPIDSPAKSIKYIWKCNWSVPWISKWKWKSQSKWKFCICHFVLLVFLFIFLVFLSSLFLWIFMVWPRKVRQHVRIKQYPRYAEHLGCIYLCIKYDSDKISMSYNSLLYAL